MPAAPIPINEAERLRSLHSLDILDTDPEERFDRLTRLGRRIFDVPIALISLVDADRQWFKSRAGFDPEETPREHSFCAHAILDEGLTIVPDATGDERFKENPLVSGEPRFRFYAGCPVKAPDGSALGTFCVIDHQPRELAGDDAQYLTDLAEMVEQEVKSLALATLDELTGLTNRRGFNSIATHTLALCARVKRPATLLFFDLDGFKDVNDTRGHAEGDRVLRHFADSLLPVFRDSDVVARVGGDEFVVLLSGTTRTDIERPLKVLEDRLLSGNGLKVPFSVGLAEYDPEAHPTVADLANDADAQMYRHKRTKK